MTEPREAGVPIELHVGRRVLEHLRDGSMHPAFLEQSQIGYVMLALLERIERLERLEASSERTEQSTSRPAVEASGVLPDGGT
jgi:hypothetical protein